MSDPLERELQNLEQNGHAEAVKTLRVLVDGIPHNWRSKSQVIPLPEDYRSGLRRFLGKKTVPGGVWFTLHNGLAGEHRRALVGSAHADGRVQFETVKLS